METAPAKPADARRHVRLVLLLLLLATVTVWARILTRKKPPIAVRAPAPLTLREATINDVPLEEVLNVPFRYDPALPVDQLQMDLFVPKGAKRLPILVYLHGGGWLGGDKSGIGPKGEGIASEGYLVASVNYRLMPATPAPNAASDVAAAIGELRQLAPMLGGDPDRMIIMGHSAGAHIGALVLADERYLAPYDGAAAAIKGLILLDGSAYDVVRMMGSRRGALFVDVFGQDRAVWEEMSPFHYATKRHGLPRTLLAYANDDGIRRRIAEEYAGTLGNGGTETEVISVPGRTHETIDDSLKLLDDPFTQHVLEFMQSCVK